MNEVREINFDGLVGPTHTFAGLSRGNVASTAHRGDKSNPRAAALQGLAKMKFLHDLGVSQAVLPPHARPDIEALRRRGLRGNDLDVLLQAAKAFPEDVRAVSSASSMWVANAATVTPSADAADHRVHFTPANLAAKFHRSIEPPQTQRILRAIFPSQEQFAIHAPVDARAHGGDEGAANHTRLCPSHGAAGLHFFVYGYSTADTHLAQPKKFPARQARESFVEISRRHGISHTAVVFAQQNPAAIDAGVFHNDVISVGNENVFLFHEAAFADTNFTVSQLRETFRRASGGSELTLIQVTEAELSLADAVRSYLFNSQIVTLPSGEMILIAPAECARLAAAREFIQRTIESRSTPLTQVHFIDLAESMRNGGGPACLRLRVVLTEPERTSANPAVFLDDELFRTLSDWVTRHYRTELSLLDLADPQLLLETRAALDELTQILRLGSVYPFQL
ncbi:MAG TPA: N-succinylarginine dihydrolase [Opitutaceae bacterium]|nr:N-succinylarginine dihydrolase [Opitutaceae bacterium]